ncbi:MAG: acyltransferase [Elusimicrobia bacterium]|nr:acyltransferase [Elusimicrobiota bacterium]
MILLEFFRRLSFWERADRLGPDIPSTHLRLHFKSSMRRLCRKKFKAFGAGSELRPGVYAIACSRISIGRGVVIRPGCVLMANAAPGGDITIEDDVLLGQGVHLYTNNHRFDDPVRSVREQGHAPDRPVVLKKGCWLGANAIVLPGVTVGENAVVGAGSIVTRDVPDGTVVAGNPAKPIK